MSLDDFLNPRIEHSNPEVRVLAIVDIKDESQLARIALHDPSYPVKSAALERITSISGYKKALAPHNSRWELPVEFRSMLLKRLEKKGRLRDFALATPGFKYMEEIFALLQDESFYPELLAKTRGRKRRRELFQKIKAPHILEELLVMEKDKEQIEAILDRLPDAERIKSLLLRTTNMALIQVLLNRFKDDELAKKLHQSGKDKAIKEMALKFVRDPAYLTKIVGITKPGPLKKTLKKQAKKSNPIYIGVRILAQCDECGFPLIINGPWKNTTCRACGARKERNESFWKGVLIRAEKTASPVTSGALVSKEKVVICPHCEALNSPNKIPGGTEQSISCHSCKKEISSYPAPDFLPMLFDRKATQIYNAESLEDVTNTNGPYCPDCKHDLKVTLSCEHCHEKYNVPSTFLRMFPIRRARVWYVRYDR